jgi:hemolysin activation/secretion protein
LLQNSVLAEGNSGNLQGSEYTEFGSGIEKNTLSDYFSPRHGIYLKLEGGFGNKKLVTPSADTISQNTSEVNRSRQFTGRLTFLQYTSISPKTTILLKLQASGMFNSQLKRNELLRLGGLQTMRGFAENYFFCAKYAISTVECLYYLEDNSSIGLFLDQAIVERSLLQKNITDYPTAIGLLVRLNAKAGIFNLAYAFGRNADAGFGFNTAVVHFGVSGRF